MAFKQEVNVPLVFTIGVISGIMLLVIVIGTQAWYQSEENNEIAQKAHEAYMEDNSMIAGASATTFLELKSRQNAALASKPRWTDTAKKDRATMPVDDAINYLIKSGVKLP